jgi:hypothetical protein
VSLMVVCTTPRMRGGLQGALWPPGNRLRACLAHQRPQHTAPCSTAWYLAAAGLERAPSSAGAGKRTRVVKISDLKRAHAARAAAQQGSALTGPASEPGAAPSQDCLPLDGSSSSSSSKQGLSEMGPSAATSDGSGSRASGDASGFGAVQPDAASGAWGGNLGAAAEAAEAAEEAEVAEAAEAAEAGEAEDALGPHQVIEGAGEIKFDLSAKTVFSSDLECSDYDGAAAASHDQVAAE